jgi:hypothetical protein
VSPWDESLDERMTILDLKRTWFRQIMDAFAREHGLEVPARAPQEASGGRPASWAPSDASEPEPATEGPFLPAHRTPGGHAA